MVAMNTTFLAIIGLCLVIGLGWVLANRRFSRIGDMNEWFWTLLARLVYFVCVPSLMIVKLDTFIWDPGQFWFVGAVTVGIVVAILLTVSLLQLFPLNREDKRTTQAISFQPNCVFLGFPLIQGILGDHALQLAIVFAGFTWPLITVASILVLTITQKDTAAVSFRTVVERIFQKLRTDPVILGCGVGLVLSLVPWDLPSALHEPLEMIGNLTSTLALLIIGARMRVTEVGNTKLAIGLVSVVKLLVIPFVTWGVIRFFPITELQTATIVLLIGAPVAASTILIVEQYGGNRTLNANAITISTLVSIVTMTMFAFVLLN